MKPIKEQIADIAADRVSGASQLAMQALETIRSAVKASRGQDNQQFTAEIQGIVAALAQCRPAMVAIRNAVLGFEARMLDYGLNIGTVETLKGVCEIWLDEIEEKLITNKQKSIVNTAGFISSSARIATCSYSSTLTAALLKAAEDGKSLHIRALRTQSGSVSYGERTLKGLATDRIIAQVIEDDHIEQALDGADLVLLGADTVFEDGSVLNGHPSLKLAEAAALHEPPVPVYIVVDSSKFCPGPIKAENEPGFDRLPGSLVEGYITEDGVWATGEIVQQVKSLASRQKDKSWG